MSRSTPDLPVKRALWIAGVAGAVVLSPSATDARPDTSVDMVLTIGQARGEVEDSTVFTPRLRVGLPISETLLLNVQWGLTTVSLLQSARVAGQPEVTEQETGPLNASVDVEYRVRAARLDASIAAGLSLPVADADDPARAGAYEVALGSVGAWDSWLYQPSTLGLTLPMRVRVDLGVIFIGVDGALFLLVPTEKENDRSTQLGAQLALEGMVPIGLFDFGLRVQAVRVGASNQLDAYLQTSLLPVVRLFLGPAILETFFTYNLDAPHETATEARGKWGVSVGGSIRF